MSLLVIVIPLKLAELKAPRSALQRPSPEKAATAVNIGEQPPNCLCRGNRAEHFSLVRSTTEPSLAPPPSASVTARSAAPRAMLGPARPQRPERMKVRGGQPGWHRRVRHQPHRGMPDSSEPSGRHNSIACMQKALSAWTDNPVRTETDTWSHRRRWFTLLFAGCGGYRGSARCVVPGPGPANE